MTGERKKEVNKSVLNDAASKDKDTSSTISGKWKGGGKGKGRPWAGDSAPTAMHGRSLDPCRAPESLPILMPRYLSPKMGFQTRRG